MPDSCCAVNCQNRREGKNKSLPFYRMPSKNTPIELRRRNEWIRALRREDWKKWSYEKISRQKVCGAHFISGKRSHDPNDVDWIPTKFVNNNEVAVENAEKKQRKRARYEKLSEKRGFAISSTNNKVIDNPEAVETAEDNFIPTEGADGIRKELAEKDMEIERLKEHTRKELAEKDMEIERLKEQLKEKGLDMKNSQQKGVLLFQEQTTGSSTIQRQLKLQKIILYQQREQMASEKDMEIERLKEQLNQTRNRFGYEKIKDSNERIRFYTGLPGKDFLEWLFRIMKDKVKSFCSTLTAEDQIILVLMKVRLGLLHQDLADRFDISSATLSRIYRLWIPALAKHLEHLIIWPERGVIRQNMPASFRKKFRDCTCIIDCAEIYIERPTNLTARAQTWSNYKHNNTCKYLIGISPAGSVMFLSHGWGGRVSDKQLTVESGFLDKVTRGDCIMADRRFLIEDELNGVGAVLKIPRFTKGKVQLSAREVDESRQLSHVRIHVERVIGRLKDFRMLQRVIPITQVNLLDNIMTIICGIINLNKCIIDKDNI